MKDLEQSASQFHGVKITGDNRTHTFLYQYDEVSDKYVARYAIVDGGSSSTQKAVIQIRRDTAANFLSNEPVLSSGEMALETDTSMVKVGDGTTEWSSLPYISSSGGDVDGNTNLIQIKRDTAVNLTSGDPVLENGEMCVETDTLKMKIGDGSTEWTSLAYVDTLQWSGSSTGLTPATGRASLELGDSATKNVGSTSGTICAGDDSRLSDSRTPTSHTHGSISNDGKIGADADKVLVTGTDGIIEAKTSGTTEQFLRGDGVWASPPSGAVNIDGGSASTNYTTEQNIDCGGA